MLPSSPPFARANAPRHSSQRPHKASRPRRHRRCRMLLAFLGRIHEQEYFHRQVVEVRTPCRDSGIQRGLPPPQRIMAVSQHVHASATIRCYGHVCYGEFTRPCQGIEAAADFRAPHRLPTLVPPLEVRFFARMMLPCTDEDSRSPSPSLRSLSSSPSCSTCNTAGPTRSLQRTPRRSRRRTGSVWPSTLSKGEVGFSYTCRHE